MSFIIQNLSSDKGEVQAARKIGATQPLIMVDGLLRGDGEGGVSQAIAGTDYVDVSEADYNVKGLRAAAYRKQVISSNQDGLFSLYSSSGIYATTGANTSSNKYCRTGFFTIGNQMAVLGLSEYEWTSWCYTASTWGTQTHSNTEKKYFNGTKPIYVIPQDSDKKYLISFKRVDGAALTTDPGDPTSDVAKIRAALKIYYCSYVDRALESEDYGARADCVGENLEQYNCVDLLSLCSVRSTATSVGITCSWDAANTRYAINGTITGNYTLSLFDKAAELPPHMKAGQSYRMIAKTSKSWIALRYKFYLSGGSTTSVVSDVRSSRTIDVPADAVGFMLELYIPYASGRTASNDYAACIILNTYSNSEIYSMVSALEAETSGFGIDYLAKYGTFTTKTTEGITFDWADGSCHVSGTSDSQAIYNIIDRRTSFPKGLAPGDSLSLDYLPSTETINLRYYVLFWGAGDTSNPISTIANYIPRGIKIPSSAVGLTVQIRVPSSTTINAYVRRIRLVKVFSKKMDTPLLVSFVDDDTSGLTYVQKYHDACRHNGVFGNFAVLTTFSENSDTMKNTLLGYEDEGFGTLIHAYRQSSDDPWQSMGSNETRIAQCRAVLAKGLRQMREFGFANYNFWVTPYGVHSSAAVRIAKDLGVECLISTNNQRHNDMQAFDRYFIKRVALRQDDTGDPNLHNTMADVKAAIDTCASAGAGWIIITTHFNEWGDLSWDTTLDENEFPIGYERFNEVVQYALASGLTPVTVPEGWAQFKTIIDENRELMDKANST